MARRPERRAIFFASTPYVSFRILRHAQGIAAYAGDGF